MKIWSKDNGDNSCWCCDTPATKTGYSKIEYMLDERKIYLHTIGGMNPLYEDILAILLKDSDIQAELKKFHESDHEEEDRKSFYRIRKVEGMSGHMYIYEDWSVFISKLPTTNTKLLFEVSSLGKISKLEISIADLYRYLLAEKQDLENENPEYECRFSRKNAARRLRQRKTHVKYCFSHAKQFFSEAKEYTYVDNSAYQSLW